MNYKWVTETLGKGLILLVILAALGWVMESAYLFYLAPANFFIGVGKIAGLIVAGAFAAFLIGLVIQILEKTINNKKPVPPSLPAPPTPPAPTTDSATPVV